jgi:hypothetical protein
MRSAERGIRGETIAAEQRAKRDGAEAKAALAEKRAARDGAGVGETKAGVHNELNA